ncbi:MAG TPA: HepT-like ribonuclease domain-containing protein [Thermoanaerobaculia bacterium]|nr:HepT-like ribonuclease domain-containing protein [Thermoanaerobaculia bacterium]
MPSLRVTTRDDFERDPLIQVWCLHHLQIIGEAASRVSGELKSREPALPWRAIVGMRNALVHGYFSVDPEEVWAVVERELAPLKSSVEAVLERLRDESS